MDPAIAECPRCGREMYHTVETCPQCGLEMYPDAVDEEALPVIEEERPREHLRFSPATAVIIGMLLGPLVTVAVTFALTRLPVTLPVMIIAPLVGGALGAFVAGYATVALCRRTARWQWVLHGLLNGLLAMQLFGGAGFFPLALRLLPIIPGLLAAYAGGALYLRLLHPPATRPRHDRRERELYDLLLRRSGGDPARAERLLDLERKHAPAADRLTLLERALERLMRDWR